jgi:hypothetical protein
MSRFGERNGYANDSIHIAREALAKDLPHPGTGVALIPFVAIVMAHAAVPNAAIIVRRSTQRAQRAQAVLIFKSLGSISVVAMRIKPIKIDSA